MATLSVRDAGKVDQVAEALRTFDSDGGSAIALATRELRELLDARCSLSFAFRQGIDGTQMDFLHARGLPEARMRDEVPRWVKLHSNERFAAWAPWKADPRQRNKVLTFERLYQLTGEANPRINDLISRYGLKMREQMRVMVCEGDVPLAWVGAYRPDPFRPREEAMLARLVPGLRGRLATERRLGGSPGCEAAMAELMDQAEAPAFLIGPGGAIAHANRSGRRALDADFEATARALRAGVAGLDGAYLVTRLAARGAPDHLLAIARREVDECSARAGRAAREWQLTPRETEVLALIARGLGNVAAAARLHCAVKTVAMHAWAIRRKSGARTRADLVARVFGGSGRSS
jgi:DNA-binding CsgD family transcriptional regulator